MSKQFNVEPHMSQQPGLRGHSHDRESDLLKRYVVEQQTPSGWLGVRSFDDTDGLAQWLLNQPADFGLMSWRIFDQRLGRVL